MYYFKDVNESNFEDVIALKIKDEQAGFLNSNLYSLAESKIFPKYVCKGIYFDAELIGFLVYNFINEDSIFLKRFMIDEKFQGLGHGKESLKEIMSYLKSQYDIKYMELMHYPDNEIASKMYESLGFYKTGETRMTDAIEHVRLYTYK